MSDAKKSSTVKGAPKLPEVQQHLVRPNDPVIGTIVSTKRCTVSDRSASYVRHIEIDVAGTALEGSWRAGQSFGVLPPGTTPSGKPHKLRLYSISCPTGGETGDGTIISTTLKRLIDEHWDDHTLYLGECSNYLADLQVGDKVELTGPAGKRFLLPENPEDHNFIFFAAGTGIAPFRGMIGDLVKAGMPSRVDLFMGVSYETDLLYDNEFKELAKDYPDRFFYRPAISRHLTHNQSRYMYVQHRLEEDRAVLTEILKSERTLIYICGIAKMEMGIFRMLKRILDPESLAQYLKIDPSIGDDPDQWDRSMIPRKIKPTKRLMLEVY